MNCFWALQQKTTTKMWLHQHNVSVYVAGRTQAFKKVKATKICSLFLPFTSTRMRSQMADKKQSRHNTGKTEGNETKRSEAHNALRCRDEAKKQRSLLNKKRFKYFSTARLLNLCMQLCDASIVAHVCVWEPNAWYANSRFAALK